MYCFVVCMSCFDMPSMHHTRSTPPGVTLQPNLRFFYSTNGWTTGPLMIQYINSIIVPYTQDTPTLLILDCYESHLTADFLRHAASHNIRVATVPASITYTHQPLDVGIFSSIKSAWRHSWEQALNEWFDERPHTQPPSSSLNHATELLSPILQHVSSSQVIRAFKQAWSFVFTNMNQQSSHHLTTSSASQASFTSDSTNLTSSIDSSELIYGPFPYHWIDPEYKPNTKRLLVPFEDKKDNSNGPCDSHPMAPAIPRTISLNILPLPATSPTFACLQCHLNFTYNRSCRCAAIPFCVQCLPLTWKCPQCLFFACIKNS